MNLFKLPTSTLINRVIPKNSFDKFTNSKEKKDFVDFVDKIRWMHKLSFETINLQGKEVSEIQIFEITLRAQNDIDHLLRIIDKAIPYPIIFLVSFETNKKIQLSKKHPHPINEDIAVIDWTFKSKWFSSVLNPFQLNPGCSFCGLN